MQRITHNQYKSRAKESPDLGSSHSSRTPKGLDSKAQGCCVRRRTHTATLGPRAPNEGTLKAFHNHDGSRGAGKGTADVSVEPLRGSAP